MSIKLSRTSRDLLDDLLAVARAWGWQQDQGHGPEVGRCETAYNSAVRAMEARIQRLEAKKEKA